MKKSSYRLVGVSVSLPCVWANGACAYLFFVKIDYKFLTFVLLLTARSGQSYFFCQNIKVCRKKLQKMQIVIFKSVNQNYCDLFCFD